MDDIAWALGQRGGRISAIQVRFWPAKGMVVRCKQAWSGLVGLDWFGSGLVWVDWVWCWVGLGWIGWSGLVWVAGLVWCWVGFVWSGLVGLDWLGCVGSCWFGVGLDWFGVGWFGLDWIGLGLVWAGLDWLGWIASVLGWVALVRVGLVWVGLVWIGLGWRTFLGGGPHAEGRRQDGKYGVVPP